jgi:PBSX family phage terminase large subunit
MNLSGSQNNLALTVAVERERRRRSRTTYAPMFRGAAREAQSIRAHEWMLAGPAETGKTFAVLWLLDRLLSETPKAQGALIRKVAADIGPTVLVTYKRVIALSGSGAKPFGGEQPLWYDYPNGARLYLGGMDRPGKVLSGERDVICVNQAEELALEDWETLTTRATGRGAVTDTPMIFGDCNPGPEYHWIINRPSLRVLYSRHEDNPTLYDEQGKLTAQGVRTMSILDALTGLRYKRLRLGLWVGAEGQVYEEFDRGLHLIDPFPIPAEWRRIRSVDFGFTNPFVCQWWAIDPDGRMYLYRELYMTGKIVADHAVKIKEFSEGERIEVTVADHDAEDRATLKRSGIKTEPAYKSVTRGIQAVQQRLRRAEDEHRRPRLFVLKGALAERDEALSQAKRPLCTLEEFGGYIWQKHADGKPNKEEPAKVDDHGMDAMRYAVAYVDELRKEKRKAKSH